jgi:hypothetical protein
MTPYTAAVATLEENGSTYAGPVMDSKALYVEDDTNCTHVLSLTFYANRRNPLDNEFLETQEDPQRRDHRYGSQGKNPGIVPSSKRLELGRHGSQPGRQGAFAGFIDIQKLSRDVPFLTPP